MPRVLGNSAFEEVTDDVHFLVGYADDVDGIAVNQIKNHMPAFGKAVVALADIRSVFAQLGMLGKPFEACINALQVAVPLSFTPSTTGITTDVF